ncbi:putative tyrosine-protein kinase RYK [Trichinella spiralis]|uniref:putative tyrosine-protein kinase RYK n=1 Tax=Trichinella spiralis TaxID=6334 RepID=UPI0001EFB750|nr:putative tyrosine-protein kinase RYK [Trichinella spiralis]
MAMFHWFTGLCTFIILRTVTAKVDLFVSNEEVQRILVPGNISKLIFHWKTSSKENIYYSISARLEKPNIIEKPEFSISPQGIVPFRSETFSVKLKCTGQSTGEVGVDIQLNYTWPSQHNFTSLLIRRRKICIRSNTASDAFDDRINGRATNVFYIALGGLFAIILIIAFSLVIYFMRVRKPNCGYEMQSSRLLSRVPAESRMQQLNSSGAHCAHAADERTLCRGAYSTPFLRSASPCSRMDINKQQQQQQSPLLTNSVTDVWGNTYAPDPGAGKILYWRSRELDIVFVLDAISVDYNRIEIDKFQLKGNFGEVYSGLLTKTDAIGVEVLIKTVKNTASESQVARFLCESLMFHGLPAHPNVSFVIAASCSPASLPMLCYAHRGFGNLKKFLHRCSGVEAGSFHSLSTQDLVLMALHICRGLIHLQRNGIVHRDIATRNCIIGEDFVVQICDTGLSRDLFPQDYHCLGDNENRPVKWLAVESIEKHEFSSASDVWAFGVTMWELVSLAQQPYHEVDPFEMTTYLMDDHRLYQPYNCPDDLYGLMFCCWNLHPEARPSFLQLLAALEDFYGRLTQYI